MTEHIHHETRDTTPDEEAVMLQYVDVRANAFNALLTKEERAEFAQSVVDLTRLLNDSTELDGGFRRHAGAIAGTRISTRCI